MSRQQFLSRLARRCWPVVYSTGALSIWERESESWQRAGWRSRKRSTDGILLHEAGRSPFRWERFPAWDRFVIRYHGRRLSHLVEEQKATGSIAYIWNPQFAPYLARLQYDWLIYHATDLHAQMPGWSAQTADMEAELVSRADAVVATSPSILRHLLGMRPKRVQLLLSGVDAELFSAGAESPCPADLAAIPRPRIGYSGNINIKVDFSLVATIAKQRQDWHWVFVGPINFKVIRQDPLMAGAYQICRNLPNVHFLGNKPYTELPAYEAYMDVNTLCYRVEEGGWWTGLSPMKLYEYLAVGKPIVGVPLETVGPYQPVVEIAVGAENWIAAIARSLGNGGVGSTERRRAMAFENTWDERTDVLEKLLLDVLQRPSD
jgi:glycosyltransferase involved in cell wall biosynthesis